MSAVTRDALHARLAENVLSPRFFDDPTFTTLCSVCARLVPDAATLNATIAALIDARLADGTGNGWRYAHMPADGEAYRVGLVGIDETSLARYGKVFTALDGAEQDDVLSLSQPATHHGPTRAADTQSRFFEELLAEVVECAYSHPLVQECIGFVGMADLPGWTSLTLDTLEAREPRPIAERPA